MSTDLQLMMVPAADIGYGRMGIYVDAELRKLGISISNSIDDPPSGTVLHCSTPAHLLKYYEGQRLAILTMFESTHLPEAFRESLHLFDTVIVPSEQNRLMFSEFHPNVHMVPLGIDPNVWQPTRRQVPVQRFTFLIGGSGPRKGVDLAYQAFRQAFPEGSWDGPEPWLILKTPRHSPFQGDRIQQINGRLTAADEIALYARAHCYVQPSRGEGFGLQPLQAIAQACPTILTDAHGHASFAHLGIGIPAPLTPTVPGSFMYGEAGDWWEPDLDALTHAMREVYEQYELACEQAWVSARAAQTDFTWAETARKINDLLSPYPPYRGTGEVMKPEVKLYRMVLTKNHRADIAGHSYDWQAFTEYHVVADVKRIMFENGLLDPGCVYGDSGLTPEQVSKAAGLTGTESFCGHCGQQMNTRQTKADWIYANS